MSALELSGERTLPGIARENYWFRRHVAAYRFAAGVVRGTVVDAGAGEGYGTALLARRGSALGVDLDRAAVGHAARRYRGPRFVRGDVQRLPLRPASVDAVVALQVIEHLDDPDAFLDGARAALRDGGVLVVSTPNRATFPAGQNPWHVREYDAADLEALLGRRFADVSVAGVHHGRALAALDRMLGEPVQHRLSSTTWEDVPAPARAVLRSIRAGAFRVSSDARGALDLVAIARAST